METPVARSADPETSVRDPERQVDTADEDVVKVPETPGALSRLRGSVTALRPAWKALGAYLIYQTMAFAIWVVPILSVFGREHIGTGLQDSRFYQWALEWTPWAVSHGINPLYASSVFAPTGVSMSWSAFVPGPALVAWPITAVFGPLASLNAWLAAAPALAAWAAYLVCNRLTHRFWASFAGGCLFGFSAYMGANIIGFINLVLVFPIPLLVYLAIRNVEGSLGPVAFVAGFTALLVGLFSISTELFGTATVFGAIAFLGALAFAKEIRRPAPALRRPDAPFRSDRRAPAPAVHPRDLRRCPRPAPAVGAQADRRRPLELHRPAAAGPAGRRHVRGRHSSGSTRSRSGTASATWVSPSS